MIVSNHMSTLETLILPGLVAPRKPCTFVVKIELLHGPIWGPIWPATGGAGTSAGALLAMPAVPSRATRASAAVVEASLDVFMVVSFMVFG